MQRCYFPAHISYRYYGARGIGVCGRWMEYKNFIADMGEAPAKLTLDRKDREQGYSPDNCRWATVTQQNNNKGDTRFLTFEGRTQTMTAWAKERGMSAQALFYRIVKAKVPVAVALTAPINHGQELKEIKT